MVKVCELCREAPCDDGNCRQGEAAIQYAKAHGEESGVDYQIGDLECVIRLCWSEMTNAQRANVRRNLRELWG